MIPLHLYLYLVQPSHSFFPPLHQLIITFPPLHTSVLLNLCLPVMNDPTKAKKIDWRFLTATSPAGRGAEADTDIFPADSTKLAPPGLFSSNSEAETAPAEFNFITLVSAEL
jgi:hypothetical protein